jgi:hypothetical protein
VHPVAARRRGVESSGNVLETFVWRRLYLASSTATVPRLPVHGHPE